MPETISTPPNIIVILVDDMGYADIGCYGGEINTPNLNCLAREGVRFSQMYNCARCCPTRASLLTGLYPHQAGVGSMVADSHIPGYRGHLQDNCVTIAEVLRARGYRTCFSGKWHVGGSYQAHKPETWTPGEPGFPTPVQRGFDEHYGMLGGGGSYFHPPYMIRNHTIIHPDLEQDDYYLTDDISDNAVRMIDRSESQDTPFFLYLAYTAPHWPLHARPEDIERYRGTYQKAGWDGLRTARHEELKGMGMLSRDWEISLRDESAPAWEDVKQKEWEDLRMAVYAAQVDCMDQGVGRVLAKLDELGITDNTLIMFLSDNGGCAEFLAEDTNKAEPFRYNIPTPDGRSMRIGNTPRIAPGADDTFASYDLPWANASNTPFRMYKHWVHEGGISTPFIVRWPGQAPAGAIRHSQCHVVDIMATCVEAAGANYPAEYNGSPIIPLEGESLVQAISQGGWTRERPIFFEHNGNRALRDGEWKLVSKTPGEWELYNMLRDRTETIDLAGKDHDRVKRMAAIYEEWAYRCQVLPQPG